MRNLNSDPRKVFVIVFVSMSDDNFWNIIVKQIQHFYHAAIGVRNIMVGV